MNLFLPRFFVQLQQLARIKNERGVGHGTVSRRTNRNVFLAAQVTEQIYEKNSFANLMAHTLNRK